MRDVVLLYDKNYFATYTANTPFSFERNLAPSDPDHTLDAKDNYADPTGGLTVDDKYTCVWGPNDLNRPKMIRIIAVVDDPRGHLGDGQTYQYVINLP